MLKWEIYVKRHNSDLRLIATLYEEDGYGYSDALTYSKACFDIMDSITHIWIFCARADDNKVVCKDHYYSGE